MMLDTKGAAELFGGNEGRQILDYMVREGYANREYLSSGIWYPQLTGQITASRYDLSKNITGVEDTAKAWKYIKDRSTQPPVKPDKVLEKLALARLKPNSLRLFSPWGPRYNRNTPKIEETDPEVATLNEIRDIFLQLRGFGYGIDFVLMPADLYGTEINSLSGTFVNEYYKWLEEMIYARLAETCNIQIRSWSDIRNDNSRRYEELRMQTEDNFDSLVGRELQLALKVSARFSPERAEESARRYCIERVVEARIVSEVYDPVKMSLVRKEKDSLDGPLPRTYIVENRAPWLM